MQPGDDRTAEEPEQQATIDERLTDELFFRSRIAAVFLLALLVPLRIVLDPILQASLPARALFWSIPVAVLARVGLAVAFASRGRSMSPRVWTLAFGLISGVIGSLFGAISVVGSSRFSTEQLLLVGVCFVGINSIGVVSLAPSLGSYLGFMIPNLSALAYVAFRHPQSGFGALFGSLVVVYVLGLASMSTYTSRQLRNVLELQIRLRESAMRDSLTGLYNRRFVHEYFEREAARLLRRRGDSGPFGGTAFLGVLLIDLDHFKGVNDSWGHDAGDVVLTQFARILRQAVRRDELVARWGGEEFAVLVPDADPESLAVLAERIRARAEGGAFVLQGRQIVRRTCSVGFTLLPVASDLMRIAGFMRAVALADAALYEAKGSGRNGWVGVEAVSASARFDETVELVREFGVSTAAEAGLIRVRRSGDPVAPAKLSYATVVRHPSARA